MHDPRFATDAAREHPDHFIEGENLRTHRVESRAAIVARGLHRYLCEVRGEDRLDAVISAAGNREEWKPPEEPRDIVEQDVFDAEDQRRPDYRVRERRLFDRRLDHRLAAEIRQRR